MGVYDFVLPALEGGTLDLQAQAGRVTLIVNVASECGLTPQYAGLERLHERFGERGLSIVGVPCNQFGEQEPGDADAIAAFCSDTYGVTFPLTAKLEVNGAGRHPLYERLTAVPDGKGNAGDVEWNFEKFLISRDGSIVGRFRPQTDPESSELVAAVEGALAQPPPADRASLHLVK